MEDEKVVHGTVLQVTSTMARIELGTGIGERFLPVWVPIDTGELKVAQPVILTIAPDRYSVPGSRVAKVLSIAYQTSHGTWTDRIIEKPKAPVPALKRTSPPLWTELLVKFGLAAAANCVPPLLWSENAVNALVQLYDCREAAVRGFLHYDHRWHTDTTDIIADFAASLQLEGRLRLVSQKSRHVAFEVERGGTWEHLSVNLGADPLSETLLPMLDQLAESLGATRRIFELDTGTDELAYLSRAPAEVEAMIREGLFEQAEIERVGTSTAAYDDWSDFTLD